jgi:hypothetical protein
MLEWIAVAGKWLGSLLGGGGTTVGIGKGNRATTITTGDRSPVHLVEGIITTITRLRRPQTPTRR